MARVKAVRQRKPSVYDQVLEYIFTNNYKEGTRVISFQREDLDRAAEALGVKAPKNLGDNIYSFRYRKELPASIRATTPTGEAWVIRSTGRSKYSLELTALLDLTPNKLLLEIKVPDATPNIVAMYASRDEQGLLTKLRYNRLVDIFTSVTCYSLQNHLRTTVPGIGQVETDEIYVGIDQHGAHYVLPIQAKGGTDKLGVVQLEQDFALCKHRFPNLICRLVAAQFMADDVIALFEFVQTDSGISLINEKHYKLVSRDQMTTNDLTTYRTLTLPTLP